MQGLNTKYIDCPFFKSIEELQNSGSPQIKSGEIVFVHGVGPFYYDPTKSGGGPLDVVSKVRGCFIRSTVTNNYVSNNIPDLYNRVIQNSYLEPYYIAPATGWSLSNTFKACVYDLVSVGYDVVSISGSFTSTSTNSGGLIGNIHQFSVTGFDFYPSIPLKIFAMHYAVAGTIEAIDIAIDSGTGSITALNGSYEENDSLVLSTTLYIPKGDFEKPTPQPPLDVTFYVDRNGNYYIDREGKFYILRH